MNNYFSSVFTEAVFAEKIVQDRCVKFWLDRHIFCEHQFGFQPNKSTLSQLLLCFNDWAKSRDEPTPTDDTDVVIMDFCKAFDSVSHERLLYKLKQHGIGGALLDWFRYFLTDRYQRVIVRGSQSNWSPVKSGVPQGTILGPILFLIYINDLPSEIQSSTKLFADDTKIYRKLVDKVADTSILQSDLDRMRNWTENWQLNFNFEKCEVMRITHSKDLSLPEYYLSDKKLEVTDKFKDLGIMMTHNLAWSSHVHNITSKANRMLGLVKRAVGSSNLATFTLLYKALIRPILEYFAPVWSPHLSKDIKALRSENPFREEHRG
jgi:hypothetical protein